MNAVRSIWAAMTIVALSFAAVRTSEASAAGAMLPADDPPAARYCVEGGEYRFEAGRTYTVVLENAPQGATLIVVGPAGETVATAETVAGIAVLSFFTVEQTGEYLLIVSSPAGLLPVELRVTVQETLLYDGVFGQDAVGEVGPIYVA